MKMKNLIKRLSIVGSIMYMIFLSACSDMNELSDRFLNEGEITYAAKVDSVTAYTGYKQVAIRMFIGNRSVNRVRVYWNDYRDSTDVQVNNQTGFFRTVIDVNESTYIFHLVSFDSYGNKSLPVEVSGEAIGDEFRSLCKNRDIVSAIYSDDTGLTITWGYVPNYSDSCILTYTNIAGETVTFSVSSSDAVTVIADWKDWEERLIYFTHFVYKEAEFTVDAISQIVSIPLYLTGTAIPEEETVTLTAQISGRQYVWNGYLNAGGFKFLYNPASDLPSLNKGADNNTLVKRTLASEPDNLFQITRAGYYMITLDIENLTIVIERSFLHRFEHIYLVGDAVPAGWDPGSAVEVTWNDGFLVYEGPLTGDGEGEDAFKILTARDWGGYNLRPLVEWASITDNRLQALDGGNDNLKWKIKPEETGYYRVTLDMSAMTIVFEKLR
jgi:hypothetical protein